MTKERIIRILPIAGSFAEDKDKARSLRIDAIEKSLDKGETIVIDFSGVEGTTQSFIHALISELFRKRGPEVLDNLLFRGCNEEVKGIIQLVVDYMQEAL